MSTLEKFILEKFIIANIFVSMIRSTPPQYSILLCLWQQQGQLGKAAFNMVLAKACQIILSFPFSHNRQAIAKEPVLVATE